MKDRGEKTEEMAVPSAAGRPDRPTACSPGGATAEGAWTDGGIRRRAECFTSQPG